MISIALFLALEVFDYCIIIDVIYKFNKRNVLVLFKVIRK